MFLLRVGGEELLFVGRGRGGNGVEMGENMRANMNKVLTGDSENGVSVSGVSSKRVVVLFKYLNFNGKNGILL